MTDRLASLDVLSVWFGGQASINLVLVAYAQWEDIKDNPVSPEFRAENRNKPPKETEYSWLVVRLIDREESITLQEDEGEDFLRAWHAFVGARP